MEIRRPIGPEGTRWCPRCKSFVPTSDFYSDGRSREKLRAYCRKCDLAWQREWRRQQGVKPKARPTGAEGTNWCSACRDFLPLQEFGVSKLTCLACLRARSIRRKGGPKAKPKGRCLQIPVSTGQRRCSRCSTVKPLEEFYRINNGRQYASRCKPCTVEMFRAYGAAKKNEWTARHRRKLKDMVFDAYGGQCVCCGIADRVFLTIDHVGGGGAAHRRLLGKGHKSSGAPRIYWWLVQHGFPPGFETTCRNCNWARHILGTCPHQVLPAPIKYVTAAELRQEYPAP